MIGIAPFASAHADGVIETILPVQQKEFGVAVTLQDQPDLLDIGSRQAALRKMFVRTEYRGRAQGVAQRLLDALMTWSGEHGLQEVFLGTTEQFLAAHRFYAKNGFREITRAELPSSFPVMAVDTKFYARRCQ